MPPLQQKRGKPLPTILNMMRNIHRKEEIYCGVVRGSDVGRIEHEFFISRNIYLLPEMISARRSTSVGGERTLNTPVVSGGADGTDVAADVDDEPPTGGGGGPYCAATRAGRAIRAREVVKIMLLVWWR